MKYIFKFKLLIFIVVLIFLLLPFFLVKADNSSSQDAEPPTLVDITNSLEKTGGLNGIGINASNLDKPDAIYRSIGLFINMAISLVGIIAVFFLVYAGWLWFTAQGNEEQIGKAKKITKDSIIAVVIVLSAYVIYNALFYLLAL